MRTLEGELKQIEERHKIEQFANTGNTQTVGYLMKESQDLRNEIFEKNSRINQLEQEVEQMKSKFYNTEIANIPKNIHQNALPPRTRNTTTIESGN